MLGYWDAGVLGYWDAGVLGVTCNLRPATCTLISFFLLQENAFHFGDLYLPLQA